MILFIKPVFFLTLDFFGGGEEGGFWLQGDSLPSMGAPPRCPKNSAPLLKKPEISRVYKSRGALRCNISHKTNRILSDN